MVAIAAAAADAASAAAAAAAEEEKYMCFFMMTHERRAACDKINHQPQRGLEGRWRPSLNDLEPGAARLRSASDHSDHLS